MTTASELLNDEQEFVASGQHRKRELGQFFTPSSVADFMASLFDVNRGDLDVLDAGAGSGALSAALIRRICASPQKPRRVSVTAYELDETLIESLRATMFACQQECERVGIRFSSKVINEDFIAAAVPMVRGDLFASQQPHFNAAIVNPPYRKIRSDSPTRLLLRSAGIETGNLYAAFVGLITQLLANRGELVAITPRSFCNGPYFKPFRADFLHAMSLRRLHVFESRSAAFGHDDVLQENIIVHAVKGRAKPERVVISHSSGAPGGLIVERGVAFTDVVSPDDAQQFIHLAENKGHNCARAAIGRLSASLSDSGLSVSTGRVVDFRAREFLREHSQNDTVPLIYPCHFNGGFVHWPKKETRKPNAIVNNEQTHALLVPAGVYVLVKRFTAKEERKRIVACIFNPEHVSAPFVGFENHLNYFHCKGQGLSMPLAKGLAAFLNSTVVDVYFRQFNGNTQVNATDLRSLNYPTRLALEDLGHKIIDPGGLQVELDAVVEQELF